MKSIQSQTGLLLRFAATVISALAFIELATQVLAGNTQTFDRMVLLAMRRTGDLSTPIGPHWLESAFVNITALGDTFVIALITTISVLFLLVANRFKLAMLVVVSVAGGFLVESTMKLQFGRARPELIPHLVAINTPSFPSGHAMLSTITYVTLGLLIARSVAALRIKMFILGTSAFLALIIGVSRVYLGVHWPTDVLAGWMAGGVWVLGIWLILSMIDRKPS